MTTAYEKLTPVASIRRLPARAGHVIAALLICVTATSAQDSFGNGYKSAYRPSTRRGEAGYFGDRDLPAGRRFHDSQRIDDRDEWRDDYRPGTRSDYRGDYRGEYRSEYRGEYRDRNDDLFSRGRSRNDDYSGRRALPWRDQSEDIFGTGARTQPSAAPWRYDPELDRNGPAYIPWTPPRLPALEDRSRTQSDMLPSAQELISRRYQDPAVLRFIGGLSADRAAALYAEILNLIATRHIAPPNPAQLTQRGIANIVEALRNPAFAQVNRLTSDGRQATLFQQTMDVQLRQRPMQRVEDAVAMLQIAMQVSQQQLGLAPGVVAIEFIYGATESLDRFSAFMPPETAKFMNQQLGANVVGIGVQIEVKENTIVVVRILPGGSAQQSGLQKGDVIASVDGRLLQGDLEMATSLITGTEGTPVTLGIVRNGRGPTPVALVRRTVEVRSVNDVQMVDASAGIGYLKLDTFAADSARTMEQALLSLHQQGMRSLVLDLRGNPGGLLTAAVEVSNLFIPSGTIVSTRGRTQNDNLTETATQAQTWKVPLVVLVDENSASASEIFAAAIQENGRGLIVGRRTYGKGTVQTLFPLQSVSAGLRLTTAKFYSPNGREMAGAGVQPDVPVRASGNNSYTDSLDADNDIAAALEAARQGGTNGNYLSRR